MNGRGLTKPGLFVFIWGGPKTNFKGKRVGIFPLGFSFEALRNLSGPISDNHSSTSTGNLTQIPILTMTGLYFHYTGLKVCYNFSRLPSCFIAFEQTAHIPTINKGMFAFFLSISLKIREKTDCFVFMTLQHIIIES